MGDHTTLSSTVELGKLPDPIESPMDSEALRELAVKAGLRQSGVRPPLVEYTKQLWERRAFIQVLSSSKAKAENQKYRLGQLWSVLTPLLNTLVYVLVFGFLMGTRAGISNVIAYIVVGTFLYGTFQSCVTMGAKSINANLGLVRSMQFPRAVLPVSTTMTELISFLPSAVVMVVISFVAGLLNAWEPKFGPVPITWRWLLLPIAIALLYIFSQGVAFIMARVTTASPDIGNVIPFFLRLLMYVSGVIFSIPALVHNQVLVEILQHQPIAVYLYLARMCLLTEPTAPYDPSEWLWGAGWAVLFFVLGYVLFWRREETYGRD